MFDHATLNRMGGQVYSPFNRGSGTNEKATPTAMRGRMDETSYQS